MKNTIEELRILAERVRDAILHVCPTCEYGSQPVRDSPCVDCEDYARWKPSKSMPAYFLALGTLELIERVEQLEAELHEASKKEAY